MIRRGDKKSRWFDARKCRTYLVLTAMLMFRAICGAVQFASCAAQFRNRAHRIYKFLT